MGTQVYNGITIPDPEPTGDGGALLVDASKVLALRTVFAIWPLALFGGWRVDAVTAADYDGGIVGDLQSNEVSATFAKVYDSASDAYANLGESSGLTGWALDYQFMADSPTEVDATYFGNSIPFCKVDLDFDTPAIYTGNSITWHYWNGSTWAALSLAFDESDTTAQDGRRPFQQSAFFSFIPPADWVAVVVDGQLAYWIYATIDTASITQTPVAQGFQHGISTPESGFVCPNAGVITRLRVSDGATPTIHAANPVTFILMNFTTGKSTAELSWGVGKRQGEWLSLTLAVSRGDVLGVLVTGEDGTNEPENVLMELGVTLT